MCDDKMGSGKEGGSCCGGNKGGCSWGHKSLLHWLIGAVVLIIVFCFGYKLGVLRGYFGGWGYDNYGGYNMMYRNGNFGPGMMSGWRNVGVPVEKTVVPTTTEKK